MKLREKFWLWGHPEGYYNNAYGNEKISRMTPMEACLYLGVRNIFMVPDGNHTSKGVRTVNNRQYNKSFTTLRQVGWDFGDVSIAAGGNADAIEEFLEDAKDFPNIGCAVFDDFKNGGRYTKIPLEELKKTHEKFHENYVRHMDTWMVLYTMQFGLDKEEDEKFQPYLDSFDGVIMWTWAEKDVPLIPEKFEILKKMTPNTRRMCGCYLYNFGESKQATGEAVKWQLDWYREKILAGELEGVVLHTNTMADLDYEAYDVACAWMQEHGDEEIMS